MAKTKYNKLDIYLNNRTFQGQPGLKKTALVSIKINESIGWRKDPLGRVYKLYEN